MSEIFTYQRKGLDEDGKIMGQYKATGLVPKFAEKISARGLGMDINLFRPDEPL